jgi:hypothetical protein
MRDRGALVALFRDYYGGAHRLKLTREMKAMMQITDARLDRYNDNYCEMVVDVMADRLALDTIRPAGSDDFDEAQAWAVTVLERNRIDALQIAVHEAVLRDGEAYVMVQYSEDGITLARELAWDGKAGILPVWDKRGEKLVCAVKVWTEVDTQRVNIYYVDRVEKYDVLSDGNLRQIAIEETVRDGMTPGVPLIAFRNRGGGRSELTNVIPLQDSLNRTLSSMVMSAELTAFSMLFAVGFEPPASITPGMVIHAGMLENGKPVKPETLEEAQAYSAMQSTYKLQRIEAGDLSQLIGQAEFLIDQIATVSNTPIPSQMGGSTQSGEALKQRDARLLGKARRAQVQLGNAWEDVLWQAWKQQVVFGVALPPRVDGWTARWKSAEVRSDSDVRETAKMLHEWGYEREALRILSSLSMVDYSEEDIDRLMAEKTAESAAALGAITGALPTFG